MADDEAIRAEVDRQLAVMKDGCVEIYGEDDLRARLAACLRAGRPLRVKLGMDPSSPDLHIGHGVVLMKLKRFLDLGHTPIFLIGDFTARIGDDGGGLVGGEPAVPRLGQSMGLDAHDTSHLYQLGTSRNPFHGGGGSR